MNMIHLCLNAREVERTLAEGRAAALLSIEGAESIGCDPGLLEHALAHGRADDFPDLESMRTRWRAATGPMWA